MSKAKSETQKTLLSVRYDNDGGYIKARVTLPRVVCLSHRSEETLQKVGALLAALREFSVVRGN